MPFVGLEALERGGQWLGRRGRWRRVPLWQIVAVNLIIKVIRRRAAHRPSVCTERWREERRGGESLLSINNHQQMRAGAFRDGGVKLLEGTATHTHTHPESPGL